jgi:hypothetical protein
MMTQKVKAVLDKVKEVRGGDLQKALPQTKVFKIRWTQNGWTKS